MEWKVLGPLEVRANGSPVNLGGRQRQLVLAILLANARETTSTERLIDEVWGDSPPDSARKTIQAHVAHLRRALNAEKEVLEPSGDGYVLTPDSERVDSARFERGVQEARQIAESDPGEAAGILERALGLFRGSPYAGLADDALAVKIEAARLADLRLTAEEARLDALLTAGATNEVVVESEKLLAREPMRERLWGIHMLALYRAGRQSEALAAYSRARQTLAEELGIEPSAELQALELKILEHDPSLTTSSVASSVRSSTEPVRRNPYKGLRAFDEADSADFFGRVEISRQLVDRLTRRTPARLTVLTGPSGSGKSSVLRAGVIPRLRDEGFVVVDMYPGHKPEEALAEATRSAMEDWNEEESASVDVGAVDQFEEVFSMATGIEADRFLDRIADDSSSTRWILTLRADFLDELMRHPALGIRLQEALVLIPPLQDYEIEAVIVEPARRVGVEVDVALVGAMTEDVRARPAALPLLQYALTDLFDRQRDGRLTLDAYRRSGGLSGALVRRADQAFDTLDAHGQEAARQVFLQLATIAENDEFVRRRVKRASLVAGDDRSPVEEILEEFGSQRLLTFDQDPETGEATVEIAHEALLSEWPRLARWIDEAREDLQMRVGLDGAVAEWEASERDPAFLLAGGRLAQHQTWTSETSLALTEAEIGFLEESTVSAELATRRRRRRRNWIMAGFAGAAVVAAVFGLFALTSARQAEQERELAQARGWLANARAVMGDDSQLALHLALQGVTVVADDPQAIGTLREAVRNSRITSILSGGRAMYKIAFGQISANGRTVLFGNDGVVTLRDLESDVPIWTYDTGIEGSFGHAAPFFVDDEEEVAVFAAWGAEIEGDSMSPPQGIGLHVLDASTGELTRRFDLGPCGALPSIGQSSRGDSTLLLHRAVTPLWFETHGCFPDEAGRMDFQAHVVDAADGATTPVGPVFGESRIQYVDGMDQRGERVVYWSSQDSNIVLIEVASGLELARIENGPGAAASGALSQDGTIAVIGGEADADSRGLHVYDLEEGEELSVLSGHAGRTNDIMFLADGRRVVTSGEDGLVKTWDLFTGELLDEFDTGDVVAFGVSASHDEETLAIEGLGLVTSASTRPLEELGPLDACPAGDDVFFHGSSMEVRGTSLMVRELCSSEVVGFDGGRGFVLDLKTGERLEEGPMSASQGVTLSADGRLLASQVFVPGDPRPRDGIFGKVIVKNLETGVEIELDGLCDWRLGEFGSECREPPRMPFPGFIWDLDFSPDGQMLLGGNDLGTGLAWDVETGEVLEVWRFYEAEFTPDGSRIVSFDFDTGLELRDARDFSLLRRGSNFDNWHLAMTPQGDRIVASEGGDLIFFDTESLLETGRWQGIHEAAIRDIDFNQDGSVMATVSYDGFAKVWDLESGELLHEILAVSDGTRGQSVAFAENGQHLWVAAEFGPLAGYTLDIDELLDIARGRLVRELTGEECATYDIEPCPTLEELKQG